MMTMMNFSGCDRQDQGDTLDVSAWGEKRPMAVGMFLSVETSSYSEKKPGKDRQ